MRWLLAAALIMAAFPASAKIVIAHRGASGERPEHTLTAYERAIDEGADYIEPDLVPTSDGVLVARHENEISGTTDVAYRSEFAARKTTRTIDGVAVTGWFTEDFTLAELRTLRARERLPALRPRNARFDGLYQIPTLAEIITLARAKESESGRRVGLYPELKHPAYFAARGIDTTAMLTAALGQAGLSDAGQPVIVQCFEVGPLRRLRASSKFKLVQLVASEGGPADVPGKSYASMITAPGMAEVAKYADGIGLDLELTNGDPVVLAAIVGRAKAAGLAVHVWTLRRENRFLPPQYRIGTDPDAPGDLAGFWRMLQGAGVDGAFTDNPGSLSWSSAHALP